MTCKERTEQDNYKVQVAYEQDHMNEEVLMIKWHALVLSDSSIHQYCKYFPY